MTYSVQTDNEGEVYSGTNLREALKRAKKLSQENNISVYVTEVHGGDAGDIDITSFNNGLEVEL